MEILAIAKEVAGKRNYFAQLNEDEIDQVTGVSDKPHVPGRYKAGDAFNITAIYQKVASIVSNHSAIARAMQETRGKAQEIEDNLPLT